MIKLGGSVITDKTKKYSFRNKVAKRLVKEIKTSHHQQFIIVHGGGSFGHPGAEQYKLNTERPLEYDKATALVQRDMRELNNKIVDIFIENNFWAVSIPGGMVTRYEDGNLVEIERDLFQEYLDIGTTPITFGDVALDRKRGVTICSGDDLMERLSPEAEKAVFVTDVDGIYKNGEIAHDFTEELFPLSEEDLPTEDTSIDVTGGMNQKVKRMMKISARTPTYVVNGLKEGRLKRLLDDEETIYTEVKA